MIKVLILALYFFLIQSLHAQIINDSLLPPNPVTYIKNIYNSKLNNELPIFNGKQHYAYSSLIEGYAYYPDNEWKTGTVVYDGIAYNNILLKYDIVKDEVVITSPEGSIYIALFSPRIQEFTFSEFKFINIEKGNEYLLPQGFYRVLLKGQATVLSKVTKSIKEEIVNNELNRRFEQETKYYIVKEGKCRYIRNKEALLSSLQEKRKAVQDYISHNKLKYRKQIEETIVAATRFYNNH